MTTNPINVVLRRSDGADEIRGRDIPNLAEAASTAFRLAEQVSNGEEGAAMGETVSIVIMAGHRMELVIRVTAGIPLWKLP